MVTFEEKRRFPRIRLKSPIQWQIRGANELSRNAVTDDISLSGMSFTNDKFVAPDATLMLQVNVLSRILYPIAKVVWSNPMPHSDRYQVGVQFLEFDPMERRYLGDYIDMQRQVL